MAVRLRYTFSMISIHALREEGDRPRASKSQQGQVFQSTPSARRATMLRLSSAYAHGISIHALREEGDGLAPSGGTASSDFNPRPPRGGRPC